MYRNQAALVPMEWCRSQWEKGEEIIVCWLTDYLHDGRLVWKLCSPSPAPPWWPAWPLCLGLEKLWPLGEKEASLCRYESHMPRASGTEGFTECCPLSDHECWHLALTLSAANRTWNTELWQHAYQLQHEGSHFVAFSLPVQGIALPGTVLPPSFLLALQYTLCFLPLITEFPRHDALPPQPISTC